MAVEWFSELIPLGNPGKEEWPHAERGAGCTKTGLQEQGVLRTTVQEGRGGSTEAGVAVLEVPAGNTRTLQQSSIKQMQMMRPTELTASCLSPLIKAACWALHTHTQQHTVEQPSSKSHVASSIHVSMKDHQVDLMRVAQLAAVLCAAPCDYGGPNMRLS